MSLIHGTDPASCESLLTLIHRLQEIMAADIGNQPEIELRRKIAAAIAEALKIGI